MNLTWHIARKDLRRFWGPVALLCIIAVIRFGVGLSLLLANEPDRVWFGHMAVYANVLWGIGLFVTYMLVAAVVQEDSVASPAFWQTRPISGARLLAAKALGLILMFGFLPVLLSIPWWLGCGLGGTEILAAAAKALAIQMGVVLLALPWAVVTGNYGRFLLWSLVAAVAWATAALMLAGHVVGSAQAFSAETGATRLLVIGLFAGAGCLCVAIHQFVTRCTWRSIVFISVTAIAMAAVGGWWPWDGAALWSPRPMPPTGLAKEVSISFENAFAYLGFAPGDSNVVAEINLRVASLPSHYVLTPLYSEENLRWADGSVTRQARYDTWGRHPMFTGPAYGALRIVPEPRDRDWVQYTMRHNLVRVADLDPKSDSSVFESFSIVLPSDAIKRFRSDKPKFDGSFWFQLLRPAVVGERDIRVGSVISKGSSHTRIAAVENDEAKQVLWLTLVECSPAHFMNDLLSSKSLAPWKGVPVYGVVYSNRTHVSEGLNETSDDALISGVTINLRKEGFRGPERWNSSSHRWEAQRESLEGATLAEVDYPLAQGFSLPLTVDRFNLKIASAHTSRETPAGSYTVKGEVNKAGDFEMAPGTNLLYALRAAGGVSDQADLKAVTVTRTADGKSSQLVVNVEAWLQDRTSPVRIPIMEAGDVVDVPVEKIAQVP
jgi:hypothetical protein